MNNWIRGIRRNIEKSRIIEVDRSPVSKYKDRGVVVGVSAEFMMIHSLNDMFFNGYSVFPLDDVKRYRVIEDYEFFINRALKARGLAPRKYPDIVLADFATLFESANSNFPLITIHRERMYDDECYIGRVSGLTEKTVTLEKIDPGADWLRTSRYKFKDITRIDFGGDYESALWLVSCVESGDKKQIAEALKLDKPYALRSH